MKIGLALSGGGALGAAHIGVIEEIEKAGIKIDYICGTSAGSIVGALYAVNGINGIYSFFDQIFNWPIFQKKEYLLATGPYRVFEFMQKTLANELSGRQFSDCKIKFACIATNISTGKKEIIDQGDIIGAVSASSAYPILTPMQKIGANYYIDGGVTCNLPAQDTSALGASFVIGSSIYQVSAIDPKKAEKLNKIALLYRILDIFDKQLSVYEIQNCNFCFSPPVEAFKIFDFTQMRQIEKIGHNYARKNVPALVNRLKNKA